MAKKSPIVTFLGEEYYLKDLSVKLEIPYNTLRGRIFKQGLSVEAAVNKSINTPEKKELLAKFLKNEETPETPIEPEEIVEDVKDECDMFTLITINSLDHLMSELKNKKIKSVNLIDFENLCSEITQNRYMNHINNDGSINIFFYNACLHSNTFYKFIKDTTNTAFQIHIYEASPQLIDNLIIYYLGGIINKYPDININILSKDTGFTHLVKNIKCTNVTTVGCTYLDKEERFKYSLCKYIYNNHYINNRKFVLFRSLFNQAFTDFYKREILTDDTIDRLITKMLELDIMYIDSHGKNDYYKFKVDAIKEVLEINE